MRKLGSPLTVHNCLMQNWRKYRLVGQLTIRIWWECNEMLKMHLPSCSHEFNMLIMMPSTFNFCTIPIYLQNLSYRMGAFIPFHFTIPLNIWPLILKILENCSTALLTILATNKSILKNLMILRISKVSVRLFGTSFSLSINLVGTRSTLIIILLL